jgi:hypothetical protein
LLAPLPNRRGAVPYFQMSLAACPLAVALWRRRVISRIPQIQGSNRSDPQASRQTQPCRR